ncbi:MAG TPA: DUF1559 domain-containing protein [Lacipirellulaceae bacterium]|jgi:prepilin-type processing-associated H-X9-DG protein|nr:DUF1559 domain-containing protein [Lacipirellulaceae bacterium]
MDYAAAVPATDQEFQRRRGVFPQYNPAANVPFILCSSLTKQPGLLSSVNGGNGSGNEPRNNTVYDGVIVRSTWRYLSGGGALPWVGEPATMVTQPVKMSRITDGTSKTMVVSEKYIRSDNYEAGPARNSDDRGWTDGWDADEIRSTAFLPVRDGDSIGWDTTNSTNKYFGDDLANPVCGSYNVYQFGSPHTGGINAVFADGSVHTVSFDIDVTIFNSLGTRNGMALGESNDLTGIN